MSPSFFKLSALLKSVCAKAPLSHKHLGTFRHQNEEFDGMAIRRPCIAAGD